MPLPRFAAAAAVLLALVPALSAADPLEFKDGDRVVFLGSTLIEREQRYGYWELALTLKNRDKNVTFRNLGWSGDTVHGEARGRFDYQNAKKCFDEMVNLTTELKPTVIVICYGHNESFDGPAGVEKFTKGLEKLVDALAPTKARIVLMSPTPFEKGPGVADPKPLNDNLALYRDAIRATSQKRELDFVDLFQQTRDVRWAQNVNVSALWDNGIHLSELGYMLTGGLLLVESVGQLGLWGDTVVNSKEMTDLRKQIVAKNQLFFHRWRPQNETYLLGFRKHEQGRNAVEIVQFDPLVAAAEKEIAELKKLK